MAKNEKSTTIEGGYSYGNNLCSLNLNAYYTRWIDKSMTKQGSIKAPYYINMAGVNSKHMGVELEFITRPCIGPRLARCSRWATGDGIATMS